MKLSEFMKEQIELVSDKFLLEVSDTKETESRSVYFYKGRNTVWDTIKKISTVAACFALAIAAVLTFILARGNHTPADTTPADALDTSVTDETSEILMMDDDEIKEKLSLMYTPSEDGAFVINDGKVYRNVTSENLRQYKTITNELGDDILVSQNLYDTNDNIVLCSDSSCSHNSYFCPAYLPVETGDTFLFIKPEGHKNGVIYLIGFARDKLSCGDVTVDVKLDSELSQPNVLFEIDLDSNTRRVIATDVPSAALSRAFYYNGKIYVSDWMHYLSDTPSGNSVWEDSIDTFMIDVRTGDVSEYDTANDCFVLGAYDDMIYIAENNGDIIKCNIDFTGAETVTNIGAFVTQTTTENGGMRGKYYTYMIDGGYLYYFKETEVRSDVVKTVTENSKTYSGNYTAELYDLYCIDLSDSSYTPKLVDEDVIYGPMNVYGGEYYYTKFDYKFFGYYTTATNYVAIQTVNGGTLYKYNPESGKSSVVFEDCGADVSSIFEITDDYITFSGVYYKGYDEGYEYEGHNCISFFKYDLYNNELSIIRNVSDTQKVETVEEKSPFYDMNLTEKEIAFIEDLTEKDIESLTMSDIKKIEAVTIVGNIAMCEKDDRPITLSDESYESSKINYTLSEDYADCLYLLSYFTELKYVGIYHNHNLTDVSFLENLLLLEELELYYVNVEDLVLKNNPNLKAVHTTYVPVTKFKIHPDAMLRNVYFDGVYFGDLSVFEGQTEMTGLQFNFNIVPITNTEVIKGLSSINLLSLIAPECDYDFLYDLDYKIHHLTLGGRDNIDLSPIESIVSDIKTFWLFYSDGADLSILDGMPDDGYIGLSNSTPSVRGEKTAVGYKNLTEQEYEFDMVDVYKEFYKKYFGR